MRNKNLPLKRALRSALLVLLLSVVGVANVYASYDFTDVTSTGQTLYFKITNNNEHLCKMVYPGSSNSNPWGTVAQPTGMIFLPALVYYNGATWYVKSIDNYTFYGCTGITEIYISDGINTLGDYSFYGCTSLATVTVGPTVTSIGDYSFWNCPALTTVHFNAVNCSEMYTYYSSTYYSVFNAGTLTTGSSAITSLSIGNGVNRIPNYAFSNSQNLLQELDLPDGLIYIGQQAFYNCNKLTGTLSIPNSVTTIGADAFNSCGGFYGELTLSNQLTTIGNGAFRDCGGLWGDLLIPNSVTSLGDYSFYGCDGITTLTIGEGVTSIGDYSFWNCPLLGTVHFNAVNCTEMYTYVSGGYYYSVFNSGTLNSGSAAITILSVGLGVNRIPNYAFRNCQSLTSYNLPPGLVYIGQQAFYNCHNLTGNLSIPNSVTSIGDEAFNGCYGFNGTLTLSNQLGSIGAGAFNGCSGIIGHVVIPNSVTSLGDYSFYGCMGIEELTIGTGVGSIGDYSFWNCPSLETVHYNAVNCTEMQTYVSGGYYYSVFNSGILNAGSSAIDSLSIGNGVNRIPNYAFRNSQNLSGRLILPNGLISIGQQSFYNCKSLTSVLLIPNSVTSIGSEAFSGCSGLTGTLLLRTQVTSLGAGAFSGCSGLTRLVMSDGMETIGNSAFSGCMGLEGQLIIPNTVTSIGDNAFYGCTSITDLTIGTGVTTIGDYAFWNCPSLTTVHFNAVNCTEMHTYVSGGYYYSVFNSGILNSGSSAIENLTIGNGVNRIPNYAFRNSQNISGNLVLPNGLISIGQQSFYNCNSLTGSLTMHNLVTSIGSDAFNGCSGFTDTLKLSNQLGSIGSGAFSGCSGLTGPVVIPNSVTTLGDNSFYGCTGITELTIGTGVTSIGDYSFWNCPSLTKVNYNAVNCTEMQTYVSGGYYYSVFNSGTQNSGSSAIISLTIGNGVNRIPNYAFRNSTNLSGALTIPNNVSYIGKSAFYNCGNLVGTLTIPNMVTSIGDNAFDGCCGFTETLTLSNQLTTIGQSAFNGCSGLTGHLVIPNSVTSLGDYSFYGCTGISELTIGESVSSIGDYSFWNCPSLATVHFNAMNCGEMQTYISGGYYYSVFNSGTLASGVPSIMTLTLGTGVNKIPNYAFKNCSSLLGVSFPQALATIGTSAFQGCMHLSSLTLLPTTPPSVGNNAFYDVPLTIPVFVPCNLSGTYAASGGWSQFSNIMELCSNQIVATNYPAGSGTVTGSGTYAPGQICFLTAIANEGYTFYQWRNRNGEVVSTNSTYNFTVFEAGSYVAIFLPLSTYTVSASINPSEGGNVTGAGYYTQGTTCTLTATPNNGYTFVNWTENGAAVSSSAIYSFIASGSRNLVANFSSTTANYTVNALSVPVHGGTVTGGGTYAQGSVCTLTATPNIGYSFLNWRGGGSGTIVSNDPTFTFTVNGDQEFLAYFEPTNATYTEAKYLSEGWNWWSTSIEQTGINGLSQIEASLGNDGMMIKSRLNGFVTNYNGQWLGQLTSINNESTYLILTNAGCWISVTGHDATPEEHPISLPMGWSWIGCPIGTTMSVSTAMASLTPVANDQLKSRDGFAVYHPSLGWIGTLETLSPGMGLMFNSHNANTVTLTYPSSAREELLKENITAKDNHWKPIMQSFPHNMTVIAVVEMDDVEIQGEHYEIAAFANGECRGSARLMPIEALNRYMAFLTIYGDESAELNFALYNVETGKEYFDSEGNLGFAANAAVGDLMDPFRVSFRGTTGLDEWTNSFHVYPNPVEKGQIVNFDLPSMDHGEMLVEIINALGVVEAKFTVSQQNKLTFNAPAVAGIYTLRITTEGKKTCFRKLIVR